MHSYSITQLFFLFINHDYKLLVLLLIAEPWVEKSAFIAQMFVAGVMNFFVFLSLSLSLRSCSSLSFSLSNSSFSCRNNSIYELVVLTCS